MRRREEREQEEEEREENKSGHIYSSSLVAFAPATTLSDLNQCIFPSGSLSCCIIAQWAAVLRTNAPKHSHIARCEILSVFPAPRVRRTPFARWHHRNKRRGGGNSSLETV